MEWRIFAWSEESEHFEITPLSSQQNFFAEVSCCWITGPLTEESNFILFPL
jgi:hypothetical protein